MALRFRPSTAASLRRRIDAFTSSPQPAFPGVILHVADGNNTTLFSYGSHQHTSATLFGVYSVTKIICTIAFMQLVDLGAVSLDDPCVVERMLPELLAKKVLTGSVSVKGKGEDKMAWMFEERKSDITPRMLLNHTNGTGHSLFNEELRAFLGDLCDEANETSDPYSVILQSPLLWQPGTHANYGQGFDWMGVLMERLTKQALGDVFRKGVFEKMGIQRSGYMAHLGGDIATVEGVDYWPVSLNEKGGFVALEPTPQRRVERGGAWPAGNVHVQTGAMGVVSCVADLARMLGILLPQNAGVVSAAPSKHVPRGKLISRQRCRTP
jgi:CubicO group peptidase (beta-lactamase class C family)